MIHPQTPNRRGQASTESILIVLIVAVLALTAVTQLGNKIASLWASSTRTLDAGETARPDGIDLGSRPTTPPPVRTDPNPPSGGRKEVPSPLPSIRPPATPKVTALKKFRPDLRANSFAFDLRIKANDFAAKTTAEAHFGGIVRGGENVLTDIQRIGSTPPDEIALRRLDSTANSDTEGQLDLVFFDGNGSSLLEFSGNAKILARNHDVTGVANPTANANGPVKNDTFKSPDASRPRETVLTGTPKTFEDAERESILKKQNKFDLSKPDQGPKPEFNPGVKVKSVNAENTAKGRVLEGTGKLTLPNGVQVDAKLELADGLLGASQSAELGIDKRDGAGAGVGGDAQAKGTIARITVSDLPVELMVNGKKITVRVPATITLGEAALGASVGVNVKKDGSFFAGAKGQAGLTVAEVKLSGEAVVAQLEAMNMKFDTVVVVEGSVSFGVGAEAKVGFEGDSKGVKFVLGGKVQEGAGFGGSAGVGIRIAK